MLAHGLSFFFSVVGSLPSAAAWAFRGSRAMPVLVSLPITAREGATRASEAACLLPYRLAMLLSFFLLRPACVCYERYRC